MTNSIKIGPRFFQVEKKNYSNWKYALIRELLQNSVDSRGCSRIDFEITENENSNILICRDNGTGMSREILETKFLVMGETTKGGADEVGGFGKARVLICWAQATYKIYSDNYLCSGSGAEYSIEDYNSPRGCTFEIETEKADWAHIIKHVLDNCNLYQNIYIDGVSYNGNKHRGKLIRNLTFGDMYANKSAGEARLIVRSNGVWMYSKYISANARVCVEIAPQKAREVLTANRDSLQYDQEKELDMFLAELAADTKSALRDKTKKFILFADKTKCFLAKKKNQIKDIGGEMIGSLREAGQSLGGVVKTILNAPPEMGGGAISFGSPMANFGNGATTSNFTSYDGETQQTSESHQTYSFEPAIDPVLASMILVNESESAETVKIAKLYEPSIMSETGTRFKLLKQWAKINEIILDIYTDWRGGEYAWAVGFLFSDDCEAQLKTTENIRYVLLNPINKLGKMRYSVNDKRDIYELIVLACHEVSHMDCDYHNEEYAGIFTDLMKKVLGRAKEIFQAVKEVK